MKITNFFYILLFIIFLMSCFSDDNEKYYDESFLKKRILDYNPDANFNTIFPQYQEYFKLTIDELKITGIWQTYDPQIENNAEINSTIKDFIFYPNKLTVIEYFGIDEQMKGLYFDICGIWFIEDEWLKVKIYLYKEARYIESKRNYFYKTIKPYTIKVIKIKDIDEKGFTRKRFEKFNLPQDIVKYENKKNQQIRMYRVRLLYFLDIGIDSPEPPPRLYANFERIPYIVKNNLSAKQIVQSEDLLKIILNYWEEIPD